MHISVVFYLVEGVGNRHKIGATLMMVCWNQGSLGGCDDVHFGNQRSVSLDDSDIGRLECNAAHEERCHGASQMQVLGVIDVLSKRALIAATLHTHTQNTHYWFSPVVAVGAKS